MDEKARFKILLEHMDQKFEVVFEGHRALDRKIEKGLEDARLDRKDIKRQMAFFAQDLSGKIDRNREEITKNREEITKNREEITKNREEITKNREEITKNRDSIAQVDRNVAINRTKIEAVDKKISSTRRDHEERLKILEAVN